VVNKMLCVALILEMYIIVIYEAFVLELFTAFSLLVRIIPIAFIFIMNDACTVYACGLV
jgi:hypothetical protein